MRKLITMSKYIGEELHVFENAKNWKKYFSSFLKPFIKEKTLEVGAGIGGTTPFLNNGQQSSWLCMEPDAELLKQIEHKIQLGSLPHNCKCTGGTISNLNETFDTIIYIDVIEHIEDDKKEVLTAISKLNQGGHLIILVPAFNFLYSPFDKAIGHYRRYTKKMLLDLIPTGIVVKKSFYLDTVGFFSSLANKYILKQNEPTKDQILLWDRFLLKFSFILDKIFFHQFGKSVFIVVKKQN